MYTVHIISFCSHFYIVVSLERIEDTNGVKESDLLPFDQEKRKKRNSAYSFYVTASVTNSRFSPVNEFTIGSGSTTFDLGTRTQFYNAPLQQYETYYYFIRAYSEAHTPEVRVDIKCLFTYYAYNYRSLSLVPVVYHLQLVSIVLAYKWLLVINGM